MQRASAGALRTLAFKNEENKNLIVECGALSTLIQMLRAEDMGIHYEAVGVIGNLVHSSLHIKRRVLEEGALQPVIGLLSSSCNESQREAALLLGQFATTEPDYKARIVQRGAVPPLITMLGAADCQLKEMAAFALGRLAQNRDNQAGIMQAGGLQPLLELLQSKQGTLQHNAAFALYGLADNEDNIAEIIRQGGVSLLQEADLIVQVRQTGIRLRSAHHCTAPKCIKPITVWFTGQQRLCAEDNQATRGQNTGQCPKADTVCYALFSGKPWFGWVAEDFVRFLLPVVLAQTCRVAHSVVGVESDMQVPFRHQPNLSKASSLCVCVCVCVDSH